MKIRYTPNQYRFNFLNHRTKIHSLSLYILGNPAMLLKLYLSVVTRGACTTEENGTYVTKDFERTSHHNNVTMVRGKSNVVFWIFAWIICKQDCFWSISLWSTQSSVTKKYLGEQSVSIYEWLSCKKSRIHLKQACCFIRHGNVWICSVQLSTIIKFK